MKSCVVDTCTGEPARFRYAQRFQRGGAVAVMLLGVAVPALVVDMAASARAGRGVTERVSVTGKAGQANGFAEDFSGDGYGRALAVSQRGRFVAFVSQATNLVSADTNQAADVFLRDRRRRVTERVSVATGGGEAKGSSEALAMSADGRFVAFASRADNLVAGDTNELTDIFVRDRARRTTERVSVSSEGIQTRSEVDGGEPSQGPSISDDGRFVAFTSSSSDLVAGDRNGATDVFVRDRVRQRTERVSVSADGAEAKRGVAEDAVISGNGRFVVFMSESTNLVPRVRGKAVYVRDLRRRRTTVVRLGACCVGPWGYDRPWISANGRVIAFGASGRRGSPLVVYDRVRRTAVNVSANAGSPALSADGRTIVFLAYRPDLLSRGWRDYVHLFVYRRRARTIRPIVLGRPSGRWVIETTGIPALSADGRWVAFASESPTIVSGDTNNRMDIFVHEPLARR